ncbi:MAG: MarR family transcriptional regulator [Rhodobacteraceae bacterium]|nr:MarR family transcriptional regulator [Paracoccaceae bacterium]
MDDATPSTLGEIGLQRFAPYLMNRIMGRYNASMQAVLSESGLSTAKMRTLAVLSSKSGLLVNELSVYCVIEQSTMSRTLTAMLDEGLVRREEDANDSRARRIFITEKGRALFDRLWPAMGAAAEGMFNGIDEGEREAFVSTLQKILGNVRQNPF